MFCVCDCGKHKITQPYRSTRKTRWICDRCKMGRPKPVDTIRMEGANEVLELYGPWFPKKLDPGQILTNILKKKAS